MHKGLLNTLVQPLFCSLNLLFGGAHWRPGLLQTSSTLRRRNLKAHTALSLRLGLRPRVIRHENGAFRKRSFRKRRLWVFVWTGNILKRTFSNTIGSGEPHDSPGRDILKQKCKTTRNISNLTHLMHALLITFEKSSVFNKDFVLYYFQLCGVLL